jgi:hypothetical protein
METEATIPPADAGYKLTGMVGNASPPAVRTRRPTWTLMVLAVAAALIAGALAGHAWDNKNAAHEEYRNQVLTTESRFLFEESRQVVLPGPQRSLTKLDDLADSITADPGVNGSGTLTVSAGAGGFLSKQIVLDVSIDSPYASATLVTYAISIPGPGAGLDEGACVLSSTLLGPGRATRGLTLDANYFVPSCPLQWWTSKSASDPHLGQAGIPRSNVEHYE